MTVYLSQGQILFFSRTYFEFIWCCFSSTPRLSLSASRAGSVVSRTRHRTFGIHRRLGI